jgi:predicted RNase H-like nuclease
MILAGIDGAKQGSWVAVSQNTDTGQISAKSVWDLEQYLTGPGAPDIAAIDIPIGLTESGPRECDLIARKLLSPRGSCVFPAPIRAVLNCETYEEANLTSIAIQGKGISKQTFAILPRIKEVDDLLAKRPDLHRKVFEVHPELCFAAWSGSPELPEPL